MNWRNGIALGAAALSTVAIPVAAQQPYYQAQAAPPGAIETVTPGEPYVYPPGHLEWRGGVHVWVDGPYVVERPGMYWVPGRWLQRGDGTWVFEDGHWER